MAGVMLAPHFALAELNPHGNPLSAAELGRLTELAQLAERARAALGVPLRVTSGHRTAAQNAAAGGADSSQHLSGAALDFVPVGLPRDVVVTRLRVAAQLGKLGPFGQLILYPYTTGHVHLSLPRGHDDGQVLVKLSEGGYRELLRVALDRVKTAAVAAAAHPTALVLLLAVAALLILVPTGRAR